MVLTSSSVPPTLATPPPSSVLVLKAMVALWKVTLPPFGVAPMSCGAPCAQFVAAATVKVRVSEKSGWQFAKRATMYHDAGPEDMPRVAEVEVVEAATEPLTKRS